MRFQTREVKVGKVGVGGSNPIRIQSMTTSSTRDVEATVSQIQRLRDAGCEIARVTVQGMKEAFACEKIKDLLIQRGIDIPLVADIHFYPPAAMQVVEFVDKVRINPGNFVDKRATFKTIEYDNRTYQSELQKIEGKFAPLVEKCQKYNCSMRIGTNHGSLSDRILNRYGDTPAGMVESAAEFARIARKMKYHDLIFSMKSSNPKVMVQAYRLLVAKMLDWGWDYPLHLGVTEAGEGEDGRVKSAMGIGALLLDGLGDTIRVSLTEDPWEEIDPCKRLINLAKRHGHFRDPRAPLPQHQAERKPPLHLNGSVALTLNEEDRIEELGLQSRLGRWEKEGEESVDLVLASKALAKSLHRSMVDEAPRIITRQEEWHSLLINPPSWVYLSLDKDPVNEARRFFKWLEDHNLKLPVILRFSTTCSLEDLSIWASAQMGALLVDELGDGVCIEGPYPLSLRRLLSFKVLQAARMRQTKTDFVSCPGCGRTLFDLQEVSARIREKTDHLPGVKIAIMGCIVNGPGEMCDADFGYVGSAAGKIDLYVGKERIERNIPMEEAEDRLIDLIKSKGRWQEKKEIASI